MDLVLWLLVWPGSGFSAVVRPYEGSEEEGLGCLVVEGF